MFNDLQCARGRLRRYWRWCPANERSGDTLDTIMFKAGQRAVALQMRREFEASLKRKED